MNRTKIWANNDAAFKPKYEKALSNSVGLLEALVIHHTLNPRITPLRIA